MILWADIRPYVLATVLGALVGLERERRRVDPAHRAAPGVRTFAIAALLAAVAQGLDRGGPPIFLALGFAVLGVFVLASYVTGTRAGGDPGITTETALVAAYGIAALAAQGLELLAAILTVGLIALLAFKPPLHRFGHALTQEDVAAALRFALVTVVILPLLPDRAMGPYEALNPRRAWWMVSLIAGVGFASYVAFQVFGARRGAALSAVLGGMVSSTAVTLAFAGAARRRAAPARALGHATLLAWLTMYARMLVVLGVAAPRLLPAVAPPLALMALCGGAVALARRREARAAEEPAPDLRNPVRLREALQFGLLYAALRFALRMAESEFGTGGVYALAALAGLLDVDAVTLGLAQLTRDATPLEIAARGVVLAAAANTLAKGAIWRFAAGRGADATPIVGMVAMLAGAAAWLAVSAAL